MYKKTLLCSLELNFHSGRLRRKQIARSRRAIQEHFGLARFNILILATLL